MFYKQVKNRVLDYFKSFTTFSENPVYNLRNQRIHTNFTLTTSAKQRLRYFIPHILQQTPNTIKDKITTHSLLGFTLYFKNYYIKSYSITCDFTSAIDSSVPICVKCIYMRAYVCVYM